MLVVFIYSSYFSPCLVKHDPGNSFHLTNVVERFTAHLGTLPVCGLFACVGINRAGSLFRGSLSHSFLVLVDIDAAIGIFTVTPLSQAL